MIDFQVLHKKFINCDAHSCCSFIMFCLHHSFSCAYINQNTGYREAEKKRKETAASKMQL